MSGCINTEGGDEGEAYFTQWYTDRGITNAHTCMSVCVH